MESMKTILALATLLLAAASGDLLAQSGEEVLLTAVERQAERMEGVENYTVVQEVMGFESETYFERTEVDGRSVFVPRLEMGGDAADNVPATPYASFSELAERAERQGTEEVDGESCHVIVVTNFEGVDLWSPAGGGAAQFTPESATFYVDTDDYLIRRMTVSGRATVMGEAREMSFTANFQDYREVDGVTYPFITQVSVVGAAGQGSAEEQEQMRQAMEQMRAQLEAMPPEQRAMMERMMGEQMESVRSMMETGAMDLSVQVSEIRVNEGPPAGGG